MECDEWPPASATEPIRHAMKVRPLQNGIHGSFLQRFYQACNIGTNRRFYFKMINEPVWCPYCNKPCTFCKDKIWGCGFLGWYCA